MMKKFLFFLLVMAAFVACSDDDTNEPAPTGKKAKMIVVNEGPYNKGLAALSVIYEDGTSDFDIFRDVNKRPLGDIAQSIAHINGNYFVALNNSHKVEVVHPETFKSVATIELNTSSPRYIQAISETEAVVSDMGNQLIRINTITFKVVEHIEISSPIEHMATIGNKLFGQAAGGVVVFDINNITTSGMRTIEGISSISNTTNLIADKNNMLWAYTSEVGKVTLQCINPATEKIVKTVEIPFAKPNQEGFQAGSVINSLFSSWGEDLNRMDTDRTRGKLYFCLNVCKAISEWDGSVTEQMAVFTADVETGEYRLYRTLPGLNMMYGMGISPDGDVFLCDALDYSAQRGYVREFKADGTIVSTYVAVCPNMIHFTEYNK